MKAEPVVIQVGVPKSEAQREEDEIFEGSLEELLDELKEEEANEQYKQQVCRSFFFNFWRSWTRIPRKELLRYRFQKLAGIIGSKTVASLTLPNGVKTTFTELPPWYDVIRYKVCGFKYETYV